MSGADSAAWHTRNQHYVAACTRRIRRGLERAVLPGRDEPAAAEPEIPVEAGDAAPGIEAVRQAFGLSPFEREILLLCVASELDAEAGRLCAALNGDPNARAPTFAIALAALQDAHWSALSPDAPLRSAVVEVLPGATLTTSPLRIEERVLHYIVGAEATEARLAGLAEVMDHAGELAPSHAEPGRRITDAWCDPDGAMLVQLCGPSAEDKRAIFVQACDTLGLRPMRMPAHGLRLSPSESDGLARLWGRECALTGAALLLDAADADRKSAGAAADLAERLRTPVALATRERLPGVRRQTLVLDIDRPLPREQAAAWRRGLGPLEATLNGAVDRLVAQFSLPSVTIARTARRVAGPPGPRPATRCGTFAGSRRVRGWMTTRSASCRVRAGTIWCCPRSRGNFCTMWPRMPAPGRGCTTRGALRTAARGACRSPRCSQGPAGRARRWPPRCWRRNSTWTCTGSI